MNANAMQPSRSRNSSPVAVILLALAAAILWFVTRRWHYYSQITPDSYSDYFWPRRAGLVPHIFGGLLAITTGLAQLWLGLTGRIGAWHRRFGKAYVVGIIVGSLGGFYVALTIPPGNLAYSAGLFTLCLAWVVTTSMAIWSIRNRRIQQHREWMIRSYVVTFAFVTYRLGANLLRDWLQLAPGGDAADSIDMMMAWACWALPLLLAEPLIQWRAVRG
jgi:uncharacterized membrane protein YfcA